MSVDTSGHIWFRKDLAEMESPVWMLKSLFKGASEDSVLGISPEIRIGVGNDVFASCDATSP